MSNIKLKDHYWETEGIYDTAQTATQKAINGEVVESARNIIKVQDTQPTSSYNKIWLPETVGDGVQIPTWAEHQALSDIITHENLLDNWYFGKGVVNTLGITSISGTTSKSYPVDRWETGRLDVTVTDSGIQIIPISGQTNGYFQQWLSNSSGLEGKTVTLSALVDGELHTFTTTVPASGNVDSSYSNNICLRVSKGTSVSGTLFTNNTSTAKTVLAMKMEYGSKQTLAHQENGVWVLNELPNYDSEYAKSTLLDVFRNCKRTITTEPASINDIMNYDIGMYSVGISSTTIFPSNYGILEILNSGWYCEARFTAVNTTDPRTWILQWNTNKSGFYQGGVWQDEQLVVKNDLNNKVSKSGDETIAGTKTFTAYPIVDISGTRATADTAPCILGFRYQNPQGKTKGCNVIRTYGDTEDGTANTPALIGSNTGSTFITSGESAPAVIKAQNISNGEQIHLIADSGVTIWVNANTSSGANVIKAIEVGTGGVVTLAKQLQLSADGFKTSNASGYQTDLYGNFTHTSNGATNAWGLNKYDGTRTFQVVWETGEITKGIWKGTTIAVANGGTGLTASPSMLTNLGSTTAANVLQASPRPGITGTLGAANGGTGQTSLQATRNAMGLGNTTGALPVANGGTGQTSIANVKTSLGITTTKLNTTVVSTMPTGFSSCSLNAYQYGNVITGSYTVIIASNATASAWTVLASGLPAPPVTYFFDVDTTASNAASINRLRVKVEKDGKFYAALGVAGNTYNGAFAYIVS